jgi:hypothetical protein
MTSTLQNQSTALSIRQNGLLQLLTGRGQLATMEAGEATGEGTIKGQSKTQTRDNNPRGGATVVEEEIANNLGLMTATRVLLP